MVGRTERCHELGIGDLVVHPGAHMGAGEEVGLAGSPRQLTNFIGGLRIWA